ncbi:hypothetical protein THRCLA_10216 [Thraustotheca clavata]|uniref:DNA ligase n=1 Tax=Thraustotheca clavata TaxID=74557 RepID=A0A1V9YS78_9STRA|nr:hypothetical protein THRCLA_10216 [Thraustotheca clavata]
MSPAVTSVHVFDFDLTLVRAPPRHHGESVLTTEEIASIGKDWYKSPLSLNYKLKLVPLPALALLKSILGSTNQMGVVLTARHEHLRDELLSVLKKFGVNPDLAVLKPNNLHKDLSNYDPVSQISIRAAENAAYKIAAIESLIQSPNVNTLKIYEDDDAILNAMYTWAATISERRPNLTIEIIDAKLLNKPFSVMQYLKNLDCVPTDNSHSESILRELQQLSNAKAVVPFGSSALHRRGDIDVCLVIEDNESHRDAVLRVADALRKHGVPDVYESGSSRCPLLKVHWLDSMHPPVDLDIVFVHANAYAKFTPGSTKISVQSTDPNERSLMGLEMLHHIQSHVASSPISMDVFARVIDTVLLVLKAKYVHGTHYNGLPSFKISALIASYITGLIAAAPLKDVVSDFFNYAASISQVEWEDKWLDGVYVSPHLLACAQQALLDAKNATQDSSFPSSGTLSRLTQGREPSSQTIISLHVVYAEQESWKLKQQFNWKFAKSLRNLYQAHRIEVDPMPEAPQMERTFGLLGDVTTTINFFTEFAAVITSESKGLIAVDVVGTTDVAEESIEIAPDLTNDGVLSKFPRTKHLLPSKSISRDDLVLDPTDAAVFVNTEITIQEKVDGANLGLFLTNDFKVVAQNRSHFCNSETAPQFKGLDIWIQMHQFELIDLLSPPGRYVLYGEWLFAQHSIAYSKLPSYFLAFDIFDRSNQTFLSVKTVQTRLEVTSIHMVPTLFTGVYKDLSQFRSLLETKSKYYDGPVEGIVIRKESSDVLMERAKLVRDDFIQNIDDHWAKKGTVKNKLQFL